VYSVQALHCVQAVRAVYCVHAVHCLQAVNAVYCVEAEHCVRALYAAHFVGSALWTGTALYGSSASSVLCA